MKVMQMTSTVFTWKWETQSTVVGAHNCICLSVTKQILALFKFKFTLMSPAGDNMAAISRRKTSSADRLTHIFKSMLAPCFLLNTAFLSCGWFNCKIQIKFGMVWFKATAAAFWSAIVGKGTSRLGLRLGSGRWHWQDWLFGQPETCDCQLLGCEGSGRNTGPDKPNPACETKNSRLPA